METEAGAAVTRARLLQGATLSSSSEAAPVWFGLKRRVLCPLRDLSRFALRPSGDRPIVPFLGLCLPGPLLPCPHRSYRRYSWRCCRVPLKWNASVNTDCLP
jgi:hypothetical protein